MFLMTVVIQHTHLLVISAQKYFAFFTGFLVTKDIWLTAPLDLKRHFLNIHLSRIF